MSKLLQFNFWLFLIIFLWGCNQDEELQITGQVDYVGSADIYFSKQPVHYKYASKKHFSVTPESDGSFTLSIPIDSVQLIDLNINDQSYPVIAEPGQDIQVNIPRAHFPDSVNIQGYPEPWNERYISYRKRAESLQKQIDEILPDFRDGDETEIPSLYKIRFETARQYFENTPLEVLYYKTLGEYFVKRLEEITYRHEDPNFNASKNRQSVLKEAQDLNFFSFESLHAQRAGIRDFTNAFANTFGVADSLEEKYGQELTQYDVKRLGYDKLDSARTSVLQHIDERKALAYAKMHLIAERIGEMPLNVATPTYEQYLDEFEDYPDYTSFLKTFYDQIERVSPGNPAIPFSLPNQDEEIVEMKDFRGSYVLLDFWASWCIPCLDEFPHMKELYNKYSRDEFEILAISIEEDSLRWRQALQQFDNPWPQLYGGNGFQQETFDTYGGGGIPFYILVGPDGNIIRYNDARPSFNLPNILDSLITQ